MLDMKWIRQNHQLVQAAADQKGLNISIETLIQRDEQRRALLEQIEKLRQERNRISKLIPELLQKRSQEPVIASKKQVKEINVQLQDLELEHREITSQCNELLLNVPNIISEDTPIGASDQDNVEIKRVGNMPAFSFEPKNHVELGELHRLIDIPRGVKAAGSRQYYLTGLGVQLHRAVQQLALDVLVERGFTLLDVPLMVHTEAMYHTGFFPQGKEQAYQLAERDRWLVGTSEVPLVAYYDNEIIDVEEPIKLAAVSACFRSEVGSAGRDVQGLYRVHQFSKVEQVILCENSLEISEQMFEQITKNAEDILERLELPYRIMSVCTGDLSQKNYKQWDIETWMPSREAYGETHSSSIVLDFQARRSNIRYRDHFGNLRFCHTLNNTAIASPRILIPLLENHQQEDGSIRIPAALQPYMNGIKEIK